MNSEKVKEIKEALYSWQESVMISTDENYVSHKVYNREILDYINELESENDTLRNAKVVYETVDYCGEDLKKAQDRIAELEKENAKLLDSVETVQSNRCVYKCVLTKEHLTKFAEMLKAKMPCEEVFKGIWDKIDETLKEFLK